MKISAGNETTKVAKIRPASAKAPSVIGSVSLNVDVVQGLQLTIERRVGEQEVRRDIISGRYIHLALGHQDNSDKEATSRHK